jgi:hypothetical protein
MARYYLHMRNFKGDMLKDEGGAEFPSLPDARKEALLVLRDFVADAVKYGIDPPFEAIVIADAHGTPIAAVPIIAALPSTIVALFKDPVKVVPADRFEDYRKFADECRARAENAVDPNDKMSWLKLADAWLQMLPSSTISPSSQLTDWPRASDEDSKASH